MYNVTQMVAVLRGVPDDLLEARIYEFPEEIEALELIKLERDKSKILAFAKMVKGKENGIS